jgi:hypothetical protein
VKRRLSHPFDGRTPPWFYWHVEQHRDRLMGMVLYRDMQLYLFTDV